MDSSTCWSVCCHLLLRPAALLLSSSHPSSELVKLSSNDINVGDSAGDTDSPGLGRDGSSRERILSQFCCIAICIPERHWSLWSCLWWNSGDQGCIREENLHRCEHDRDPLWSHAVSSDPHDITGFVPLWSPVWRSWCRSRTLLPQQPSHGHVINTPGIVRRLTWLRWLREPAARLQSRAL